MPRWQSKHAIWGEYVCCLKLVRRCGSDMGSLGPWFCVGFASRFSSQGLFCFLLLLNWQRTLAATAVLAWDLWPGPCPGGSCCQRTSSPSYSLVLLLLKLGSAHGSHVWMYCSSSCLSSVFCPLVQAVLCHVMCLVPSLFCHFIGCCLNWLQCAVTHGSPCRRQDAAGLWNFTSVGISA